LRGKYQERYGILPVYKVEGSSQTPLHLRVTDGVTGVISFLPGTLIRATGLTPFPVALFLCPKVSL
tara:strand:+ start:20 stop:217 length:198 start_codon:yes stop_codon:yes gene_type:complete